MALPHAVSGQIIDLAAYGDWIATASTHALFKTRGLEAFRLVLGAGKKIPVHAVPGPMTFQCLEGAIDFETSARNQRLRPSQLLFLEGGVAHSVAAVEDSSALVTVALVPVTGLQDETGLP